MYPSTPRTPPSDLPARAGTAVWRLGVAACAFFGVYLVAYQPVIGWTNLWFLSQSGSLITAVCYAVLAGAVFLPRNPALASAVTWVRGALASMMLLICVASIFILGSGDLDQTGFLFEHLITPLVVAADFVLVGRDQLRTRAWHPLTWVAVPLGYLVLANLAGEATNLYGGILDPANPEFVGYVGMFTVTAIVFGYALFGLMRLRGVAGGAGTTVGPPHGPPPMPGQPYGAPRTAEPHGTAPVPGRPYGASPPGPPQGTAPVPGHVQPAPPQPPAPGYGPPPGGTQGFPPPPHR